MTTDSGRARMIERAQMMRELPIGERLSAIAAAPNVIDARFRFRPVHLLTSTEDTA